MKSAQLISQVFVYVVSALVFILILFFGYRAVTSVGEKQEQVLLYRFIQELKSSMDDLRLRYGSVDIIDFTFPKTFRELCFVTDKELVNDISLLKANRPGLHASWTSWEYDVFSIPTTDIRINIPSLEVRTENSFVSSYCCFKVSGKISLRLEGAGKTVILSSGNPDIYPCGL